MASVSVSHLILFIASMVIAASVAGVFTSSVDDLAQAIDDQGLQVSDDVRTSIEIISDSGSDNIYNDTGTPGNVTLYVKNTGSTNLIPEPRHIDVLVNGEFKADDEIGVEVVSDGNEGTWARNGVVKLTIAHDLDEGDHRVMVIVNGNEEVIQFRVDGDDT